MGKCPDETAHAWDEPFLCILRMLEDSFSIGVIHIIVLQLWVSEHFA